jgi:DNA mismatch repair protein MutS
MKKNKELIYDTYVKYHNEYNLKYNKKACVLMQCGDFFEIYGKEENGVKLGDIYTLAEAAGNLTVANKTSGWKMAGFGMDYLNKYLNFLMENNYTVVIIEQTTAQKKNPPRSVTRIISPSTYIEGINLGDAKMSKNKNRILIALYVEFIKNDIFSISMASMDVSLGTSTLYNISSKQDKELCMNECFRFIHSISPIEMTCYVETDEMLPILKSKITNLNMNILIHYNIIPKEYLKIPYLQSFLGKFYPATTITPIEYLHLTKYQSLTSIFALLIDFADEHDKTITKRLHIPVFWKNKKHLTIENNSIYQLNVVKTHNVTKSLIDILDYTNTNPGKRLFRDRILNPIIDPEILNIRYNQIEWMLCDKKFKEFESILKKILDIERIHRKIENGTIHPNHFFLLDSSNIHILAIMNLFKKYKTYDFNEDMYARFNKWSTAYREIFNIQECHNIQLNNIKTSIFNPGISTVIDDLRVRIYSQTEEIYKVGTSLSNDIKKYVTLYPKKNDEDSTLVKVDKTEKGGYYFSTTNKRAELVKKYAKLPEGWKDLRYTKMSTTTKITCDKLNNINEELEELEKDFQEKCKRVFLQKIQKLYDEHKDIFPEIVTFISEIDWLVSCAKAAATHFYCKPTIQKEEYSYFDADSMRHPIIENIMDGIHYVPNNIKLGKNGLLLFGVNSCGKSSLMKAVGLNIIMAQAGMYVACNKFTFNPYKNILTRIISEDNISKGYSSFVTEMVELHSLLQRCNEFSLVLGDEIAAASERTSAVSIVASSILELSQLKGTFIFTSHFHELSSIKYITDVQNVKFMHLTVNYNEKEDCLVYDRKLAEGPGQPIYGIEVARYIFKDNPKFIKQCFDIRFEIQNDELIIGKPSKYNSKLVSPECLICGKKGIDDHHINMQCTANEDNVIEFDEIKFNKNKLANLVRLCKFCHIKTHNSVDGKKYVIRGYKQGVNGRFLDWEEIDC